MVRAIGSAWASRVTDFANLTRIVGAMPTLRYSINAFERGTPAERHPRCKRCSLR
jgi:hypothetical protein